MTIYLGSVTEKTLGLPVITTEFSGQPSGPQSV